MTNESLGEPMERSRTGGGGAGGLDPLIKSQNIGFVCITGPDFLKYHKAIKTAFNVGPLSAHQLNDISMAYRWRADVDPFIAVIGSSNPSSTKKTKTKTKHYQMWTPSDKTF